MYLYVLYVYMSTYLYVLSNLQKSVNNLPQLYPLQKDKERQLIDTYKLLILVSDASQRNSFALNPPLLQPSANCPDTPANNWLGGFIVACQARRHKSSKKVQKGNGPQI